jgi:carotenoid cleavage dioxygenase-like enzyme
MPADEHGVPDVTAIPWLDTDSGSLRDLDLGSVPVGEPALASDRECGEGCWLSLVQRAGENGDSGRTALQVRNAADLSIAAESMLPPVVPLGFHGCWVPRANLE